MNDNTETPNYDYLRLVRLKQPNKAIDVIDKRGIQSILMDGSDIVLLYGLNQGLNTTTYYYTDDMIIYVNQGMIEEDLDFEEYPEYII
jgi:hypothetical protein